MVSYCRVFTVVTLFLAISGVSITGSAADETTYKRFSTKGAFEDVFQDLKDAVIDRGFVIDNVGHVDKMLERTSEAAESVTPDGVKSPYLHAKYLQFCSAKLTHEAVSANTFSLAVCPLVLFAFETRADPGTIFVGYRRPISGPSKLTRKAMAKMDALLDGISREAASVE